MSDDAIRPSLAQTVNARTPCRPSRVQQCVERYPAILFALWAIWLSWEYWLPGSLSYVQIHDTGDSTLPAWMVDSLSGAQAWNPRAVCGLDRWAVVLGFHPVGVLISIVHSWWGYGLFLGLQRFVAGYFFFRLLRERAGLTALPCLLAGLEYSLFAQPSANSPAGFTLYDLLGCPGLPLWIWLFYKLQDRNTRWVWLGAFVLGLVQGVTVLYAFAPFIWGAIVIWFLCSPVRDLRRWLGLFVVMVAGYFAINALSIWAAFLNTPFSHRAAWIPDSPLVRGWNGNWQWIKAIVHDNSFACVLAVMGALVSRGRERALVRLCLYLLLIFLFILSCDFLTARLFAHLGFLKGFALNRIHVVVPFLVVAAAALALHYFSASLQGIRSQVARATLSTALWLLGGLILWQSLLLKRTALHELSNGSNWKAMYENSDLRKLAQAQNPKTPFRVATIAKNSGPEYQPGYGLAYGLETADGYVNLYSKRYQDYWEQVLAPLLASDTVTYNYFHYWGSRVYLFWPSKGFPAQGLSRFADYYRLELLSLANVRYIISPRPMDDPRLLLLPSPTRDLAIEWAAQPRRWSLGANAESYPGLPLYIYENREVFPRYFLVHRTKLFQNSAELLQGLRSAQTADLRSSAFLNEAETPGISLSESGASESEVSLVRQTDDEIELQIESHAPSILVMANTYSPFWQARVNGAPARVFPVDHTFQGVLLPAGRQHVIAFYQPKYAIWKKSPAL